MANTLDGSSFAEHYVREAQEVDDIVPVYRAICKYNGFGADTLRFGDKINLPKTSALYVDGYTRGTAVTVQDLTNSIDYLTIDQQKQIAFYVDDFDAIQESFDSAVQYGNQVGTRMAAWKDADVLAEAANAGKAVDDADITGGTSGNGATVTTANIYKMFTAAKKKLALQNVPKNMLFAVVSPNVMQVLEEYLINKGTPMGDQMSRNGYKGQLPLLGIDVFESNNLYSTFELVLSDDVTDGDTIAFTINDHISGATTITITFQSSLTGGTATNEVLMGANAAATRVNLAALINASAGDTTLYEDFSAVNRLRLKGLTATDVIASTKVTFTWKGAGTITLTEAITHANDVFTAAKQVQHQLIGVKGATNIVCQKEPKMEVKDVQDKFGKNFLNGMLYGIKTDTAGARRLVDVKVRFDGTGF